MIERENMNNETEIDADAICERAASIAERRLRADIEEIATRAATQAAQTAGAAAIAQTLRSLGIDYTSAAGVSDFHENMAFLRAARAGEGGFADFNENMSFVRAARNGVTKVRIGIITSVMSAIAVAVATFFMTKS